MLKPSELQAHETVNTVSEAPESSPESVQLASVLSVSGSERTSSWTDCRIDSALAECSGAVGGHRKIDCFGNIRSGGSVDFKLGAFEWLWGSAKLCGFFFVWCGIEGGVGGGGGSKVCAQQDLNGVRYKKGYRSTGAASGRPARNLTADLMVGGQVHYQSTTRVPLKKSKQCVSACLPACLTN